MAIPLDIDGNVAAPESSRSITPIGLESCLVITGGLVWRSARQGLKKLRQLRRHGKMNNVREIQALNKLELENAMWVPLLSSWYLILTHL